LAKDRSQRDDYTAPLRRLLTGVVCLCLLAIFLIWRIDSPRVERFRAQVVDAVVPSMDWAMIPVEGAINLFRDFQSYQRLAEQNRELRSELRQMRAWKEAALQLEQENARLLDLNNVRLDPRLTYVTGVVMADSVHSLNVRHQDLFATLEWGFTLLFTAEYLARLTCLRRPWRYALSFFGLVDLLAILPTYLALLVPEAHLLIDVRILRLLRMFRVLKLTAYLGEYQMLGSALLVGHSGCKRFLRPILEELGCGLGRLRAEQSFELHPAKPP